MSETQIVKGTLQLFDDNKGEYSLSNGQSFTILSEEDFYSWRDKWVQENYPNGGAPKMFTQFPIIHGNGLIDFLFSYYSFDYNANSYLGTESEVEHYLIETKVIADVS